MEPFDKVLAEGSTYSIDYEGRQYEEIATRAFEQFANRPDHELSPEAGFAKASAGALLALLMFMRAAARSKDAQDSASHGQG
jgi:hypothetical protein